MYLPSFYKLQFEKYLFNSKRAGMFMIPVVLWSKTFILYFSRMGILSQLLQHHRIQSKANELQTDPNWRKTLQQRSPKKNPRWIMILIVHTKIYLTISMHHQSSSLYVHEIYFGPPFPKYLKSIEIFELNLIMHTGASDWTSNLIFPVKK